MTAKEALEKLGYVNSTGVYVPKYVKYCVSWIINRVKGMK